MNIHFHSWTAVLFTIGFRYFLVAGIFWLIWYVARREKSGWKKIQQRFPAQKDYVREIGFSLMTIVIFAAVSSAMLLTPFRQYTQYYQHISEHGWLWFWAAFPLMFLYHDTYFYWTHRMMHHPRLFKLFHLVHHKSTNPSPWAALAFHPLEALVEVGSFATMIMLIPINFIHVLVFFLAMMVYNVYGHLGWELYPKNFSRHRIGKWINTGINHNQHHQYFKGNYGLYFLWWDRWMGTLRSDYDQKFDEVTTRTQVAGNEKPAGKKIAYPAGATAVTP